MPIHSNDPFRIQEGRHGKGYLKNFTANNEAGDTLITSAMGSFLGKSLGRRALIGYTVLVLAVFLSLSCRAFYLQVYAGDDFESLAEGNRTKRLILPAPRGILYDITGAPLVYNTWNFSLYIDRRELTNKQNEFVFLETLLADIDKTRDWQKRLELELPDPILIAEGLPYEKALELLAESRFHDEIVVVYEPGRTYATDSGLSHLVGYTGLISAEELQATPKGEYLNNDTIGKAGIEVAYEKLLRGKFGFQDTEVDALGREYQKTNLQEPLQGNDLKLTIDLTVQRALYQAMTQVADESKKTRMAGVVLDPQSGGVRAMVSLPDFDPNVFSHRLSQEEFDTLIKNEDQPLYNRAISGEYPAGSTFKIIMASAGLQEKVVTPETTVISTGGVRINNFFFPDWRPRGHGVTNIYHALADSVNTYFYLLGGGDNAGKNGLGLERIRNYAVKFGLADTLGIDLPGESTGFVPDEAWKLETKGERWYLGDTYNLSIGQGDLTVTPLQMAHAASIIASDGLDTTPHIVEWVSNFNTLELPQSQPISWLSQETIQVVRKGLRQTVHGGSASSLQSVRVPVAGKTGTAQFNRNKQPHSWFTGFAPYDNPQLVFAIIVEEGGDQGLAVRASRLFLEKIFNNQKDNNE